MCAESIVKLAPTPPHLLAYPSFLSNIESGVLQGCPLSGFLFCLAITPLLEAFEKIEASDEQCLARACADDIGVIAFMKHIPELKRLFDRFQRISALSLNFSKCIAVPLWCAWRPQLIETVRDGLAAAAGEWCRFVVAPQAKYLGFLLGPSVTSDMLWLPVLRSYLQI